MYSNKIIEIASLMMNKIQIYVRVNKFKDVVIYKLIL
jgi:hypothetical protein